MIGGDGGVVEEGKGVVEMLGHGTWHVLFAGVEPNIGCCFE